jgi:thiamine kinase-like enzyme
MISGMLLTVVLATPSYNVERKMTPARVRSKAHQIVQMLKKQDPRVLRSVMYYMKWVPRLEYRREKCKKNIIKTNPDPVMDMLLNEAGIKRKRR